MARSKQARAALPDQEVQRLADRASDAWNASAEVEELDQLGRRWRFSPLRGADISLRLEAFGDAGISASRTMPQAELAVDDARTRLASLVQAMDADLEADR